MGSSCHTMFKSCHNNYLNNNCEFSGILKNIYSFAAHIPLYLYPFLNTTSKSRPFEYLRLTSLGVIGALVKVIYPSTHTHANHLLPVFLLGENVSCMHGSVCTFCVICLLTSDSLNLDHIHKHNILPGNCLVLPVEYFSNPLFPVFFSKRIVSCMHGTVCIFLFVCSL